MNLPPELWCYIAQYIPLATLKGLYAVNQTLYRLAMNERSRLFKLDKIDHLLVHKLERLREPEVAQRVQSIHVVPFVIEKWIETARALDAPRLSPSLAVQLKFFLHAVTGLRAGFLRDETDMSAQITEGFASAIPGLVNVRKFYLQWDSNCHDSPPHTERVWESLFHNLHELRIAVTPQNVVAMFPLQATLPYLQILQVRIDCRDSLRHIATSLSLLSCFVNLFQSTLESLDVECYPAQDLSSFYGCLGSFSHLSSVGLDVSKLTDSFDIHILLQCAMFLQRQSNTLQHLSLSTSSQPDRLVAGNLQVNLSNVTLPRLRSLSVADDLIAFSWMQSFDFLKKHACSLMTLTINGPLAPWELPPLLDALHHQNQLFSLTNLSIAIHQLNSNVLDQISKTMCRLERLSLKIREVSCDSAPAIVPWQFFPQSSVSAEHPFVHELRLNESLKEWNLIDITIKRRSCCGELMLWGLMALCAECIPSISSFLGNGDMLVPNPPNERPQGPDGTAVCTKLRCLYGADAWR
ncbi:hypothetical protein B0H34DRAFT_483886 [Crassisporium funariophilum]|nr:hypothetical protein B0H34DRAFT_483886 [Crassisporium funariophilum]